MAACHNCRRRRLKCDRSLPQCLKCVRSGQECLGYQRLFRWQRGVASRGKMMGMTFSDVANDCASRETQVQQLPSPESTSSQLSSNESSGFSPCGLLTDPLLQDMKYDLRKYLHYFTSDVCKDLVLYDIPEHNPFRDLVPMTSQHPVLLHIIVANAALHMCNAGQKSLILNTTAFPRQHDISKVSTLCSSPSEFLDKVVHNDALVGKQRALQLLKSEISSMGTVEVDVTLAVVLLFIEFQLIDSGRDDWKHHVKGARVLVERLCSSKLSTKSAMSSLRRCLIANCLVFVQPNVFRKTCCIFTDFPQTRFDILGSTLTSQTSPESSELVAAGAVSLLRDAEGNHCSSFPTELLQLIQAGARLIQNDDTYSVSALSASSKAEKALLLLSRAQSFDTFAWATNLQSRSPTSDVLLRTHIACAHRAAVCIYLSRISLSINPDTALPYDLESFVETIMNHLSFIQASHSLFKATTWPAFIAGAETHDPERQRWVAGRFQDLWDIEPWGLIRGAMGVLKRIWANRCGSVSERGRAGDEDWIKDLRGAGVDWLIL